MGLYDTVTFKFHQSEHYPRTVLQFFSSQVVAFTIYYRTAVQRKRPFTSPRKFDITPTSEEHWTGLIF